VPRRFIERWVSKDPQYRIVRGGLLSSGNPKDSNESNATPIPVVTSQVFKTLFSLSDPVLYSYTQASERAVILTPSAVLDFSSSAMQTYAPFTVSPNELAMFVGMAAADEAEAIVIDARQLVAKHASSLQLYMSSSADRTAERVRATQDFARQQDEILRDRSPLLPTPSRVTRTQHPEAKWETGADSQETHRLGLSPLEPKSTRYAPTILTDSEFTSYSQPVETVLPDAQPFLIPYTDSVLDTTPGVLSYDSQMNMDLGSPYLYDPRLDLADMYRR